MKLIACVDNNWGIGKDNDLLFDIPEDKKRFSALTKEAGVVIMGRRTFESINKFLPNRINIILTSKSRDYKLNFDSINYKTTGFVCLDSVSAVIEFLLINGLFDKAYVIGGEKIYNEFYKYCSSAEITKVYSCKEADTFCINLDKDENWEVVSESLVMNSKDIDYAFIEYINKNPKSIDYLIDSEE